MIRIIKGEASNLRDWPTGHASRGRCACAKGSTGVEKDVSHWDKDKRTQTD